MKQLRHPCDILTSTSDSIDYMLKLADRASPSAPTSRSDQDFLTPCFLLYNWQVSISSLITLDKCWEESSLLLVAGAGSAWS
jgi:hypothetical protein